MTRVFGLIFEIPPTLTRKVGGRASGESLLKEAWVEDCANQMDIISNTYYLQLKRVVLRCRYSSLDLEGRTSWGLRAGGVVLQLVVVLLTVWLMFGV